MNKQKQRRSRRDTALVLLFGVGLLVAALVVCLVLRRPAGRTDGASVKTEQLEGKPDELAVDGFTPLPQLAARELSDGLRLLGGGYYSGDYVEDGSDEPVQNVLALLVENDGEELLEYAQLCLPLGDGYAYFDLSGLPAQGKCIVLARERVAYSDAMTPGEPTVVQAAPLGEHAVTDFGAEFRLSAADSVLNLTNVSGRAVESDVSVCYKNYRDGLYWGGIAYRAGFAGGFREGETRQSIQRHFSEAASVILYMIYERP